MLQVVLNIFKSIWSLILSILRPCRRLICRRRRTSDAGPSELTSIGTGDLRIETPSPYGGNENGGEEIEMEAWDTWGTQSSENQAYPTQGNGQANKGKPSVENYYYNQKMAQQPEPEPEPDFFGDMTPEVKKQPKIVIRKKEHVSSNASGSLINRMAVMADAPLVNSELTAWEEQNNAWDTEEVAEDLTWQAEEAIREERKKERIARQQEHQRRKQKREEMRGLKGGSNLATKLS